MKKVFLLLSIILILIAIPATVFLVGKQQELRKKAAPATTLAFSPASVNKKVGETFSLEVTIDAGENQVVAAELHIVYDPVKLEAQTITNSTLFPNILTSGTVERGAASITVGAASGAKPITGTGTVAVIRLKALEKTDTPATVRLAQNTFVGSIGEGQTNVLVGTTPATVTITDPGSGAGSGSASQSAQLITSPKPTMSPTPATSSSAAATTSATLAITNIASGSAITTSIPTIRGKATPGAVVTITIYSTPQTVTVKADANGNWSYTPITPLADGSHNVVVSAADASGTTKTATTQFVVAAGGSATPSASATISAQPIPRSGTVSWTLATIAAGLFVFIMGIVSFGLLTN
ncbi:hypothetical protein HY086_05555 [Candidatus Gottesmanbacteria bacterium]|nr:hypothetical protein [Candidatus Gottesmanbacteria bacterium]